MPLVVKNSKFVLPVTALELVSINSLQYICAGIGPRLLVISEEDGTSQSHCDVLDHHCIHGIRVIVNSDHTHWLVVFGQKAVTIVTIDAVDYSVKLISREVVELSDWVLDVHWLRNIDQSASDELTVVTAHNNVLGWNWKRNECTRAVCSQVNCILYSAQFHGTMWDDLCVAVGTVFNEVLVWKVCGQQVNNRVSVAVTLKGHEGVIFSVRFSNHSDMICSVSDDRSVRVWKLPGNYGNQNGVVLTQASLVLYGHTSRVWDAIIIPTTGIVSVGEDSTCRMWNLTGECVKVIEGHKGRGIWSMCVNKNDNKVITGGADGGIRASSLAALQVGGADNMNLNATSWEVWLPEDRKPQSLILTDDVTALVLTTTGHLYKVKLDKCSSSSCELLEADPAFAAYSIMSLSPTGGHLAMSNLLGSVKVLPQPYNGNCYHHTVHHGKVFSLHWTMTSSLLISCGPDGHMCCWRLCGTELVKMADMLLPWSKHRWLSAITEVPSSQLVCGDKKGSIHLYKLPSDYNGEQIEPLFTLKGIHGPNGVTYLCYNNGLLYSTGRDGFCRQYKIDQSETALVELAKYKVFRGLEWIERILFVHGHQLVVGFHSADFVIFDVTDNKMLYHCHCGGGHRSWDLFLPHQQVFDTPSMFGYIKEGHVYYRQFTLDSGSNIVMEGIHGREITCVASIGHRNGSIYFITASEDTDINVMELDGNTLRCKYIAHGHISTVRALSCCHSRGESLLFSGGGRASFKVWRVTIATEGMAGPALTLLSEKYLHEMTEKQKRKHIRKTPFVPTPPECRIMSLTSLPLLCEEELTSTAAAPSTVYCVIAGCSDSYVRIYTYCDDRGMVLVEQLEHHGRCVLCVKHFTHPKATCANTSVASNHSKATCANTSVTSNHSKATCANTPWPAVQLYNHLLICSAATDGQLVLWDITMVLQRWLDSVWGTCSSEDELTPVVVPLCAVQCHQSGINDMDIQFVPRSGEYHIISCGDDGSVAVTTLLLDVSSTSDELSVTHHEVSIEPYAHSSCCTGVHWLPHGDDNQFMSVSIDQRMSVWGVSNKRIIHLSSYIIHVADVAAMEMIRRTDYNDYCVIVCGVGLQCLLCSKQ